MPALAVAVGAVVGSLLRWAGRGIGGDPPLGTWHWGTFLANVAGCVLLGFVVARAAHLDPAVRAGVAVGFCGGLTTFSGLAVEVAALLDAGRVAVAVTALVTSAAVGTAGFEIARRSVEHPESAPTTRRAQEAPDR